VAALIKRAFEQKESGKLTVWGSGKPLRQFCYIEDFCELLLWIALRKERTETIALLPPQEHSIRDLAQCIADELSIPLLEFDASKSDGQYRKTMSHK
jgi:nucleoside-diphosphate-sugar epimerase